jgi:hypothetical protein
MPWIISNYKIICRVIGSWELFYFSNFSIKALYIYVVVSLQLEEVYGKLQRRNKLVGTTGGILPHEIL